MGEEMKTQDNSVLPSQPMTATHTPTPWVYRPRDYDDWGWIRGPDGVLAATARSACEYDADEHRRNGTDPFEANAAIIVEAVNSHASLKARIQELEAALQVAQELFAIVVNPQDHPNTSVQHLWAQCKEMECKIRDLLQPKDGAK
jgi:hypothetical protein